MVKSVKRTTKKVVGGIGSSFSKVSAEEARAQSARTSEKMAILRERAADADAQIAAEKKEAETAGAAERKRKQRAKEREQEIEQGLWSPGGTKHKRNVEVI